MPLTSNGNLTDLADTGYSMADLQSFLQGEAQKYGVTVESGDAQLLANKLMGEAGFIKVLGGNPRGAFDLFSEQYRRRGTGTPGVSPDSSTLNTGSAHAVNPSYAQGVINSISGNVATIGPAAIAPSGTSTGPTGLLAAPLTYVQDPGGGGLFAPSAGGGGLNMTWILILGGAAVAAYLFLRK